MEKLISETENVFASCLEGGDKARAMKKLRVPPLGGKVSWSDEKHACAHTAKQVLLLHYIYMHIRTYPMGHPCTTWIL